MNQLGLDESFLRFHYDCSDDQERTLTGTTLLAIAAASGVVLAMLLLGAPVASRVLLGSTEHAGAIRLLAVNGFLSAFLCVPHSLLRIRNQPLRFARWTIGGGLGTVAGRLLFVVGLRMGVFGIMLADVVVSAVLLVGLLPVVGNLLVCRFSWRLAHELLRYGLPRVPDTLLRQTMGVSDRFFLRAHLPLLDVGIYQVGTSVANVLKVLPEAFRRSWMPFAFETMGRPDAPRVFARMATAALSALVFAALCLVVFREPLIQLMTQAAFHDASEVVPLLTLGIAVHAPVDLSHDFAERREEPARAAAGDRGRRRGHGRRQPDVDPALRHARCGRGRRRRLDRLRCGGRLRRPAAISHPVRGGKALARCAGWLHAVRGGNVRTVRPVRSWGSYRASPSSPRFRLLCLPQASSSDMR